MNEYTGWVANTLLITGTLGVGLKNKLGFLVIATGEAFWLGTVLHRSPVQWDMVFICCVFGSLALFNFACWTFMDWRARNAA